MLGTASKIIILCILIGVCLQLAGIQTIDVDYYNLTENPLALAGSLVNSALGPINLLKPVFDSNTPVEVKAIMLIFAVPLSVAYALAWLSWLRGKVL